MKRRQAGFTLTEMMIVVSIIGVLVTMAIVYLRPHVRPIDVAGRFGDLVREASRRAVALGPVRSDVAVALGSKARTRITATASAVTREAPSVTFTQVTFTLWRFQEDPLPAATGSWIAVEQYMTDANVDVESWAPDVADHTSTKRTTDWTAWTPPAGAASPLQCRPNGTCDPVTVFFQAVLPGPSCDPLASPSGPIYEQCGKASAMPLGGAITTRADWK